jgi:hypothetical protein
VTFDKAAWSIDGPITKASLARIAEYIGTGGAEGIVGKGDLKVSPTAPNTRGIVIAGGAGLVLNRYQGSSVNQSYAVSNTGDHTITSGSMPAVSASAQEFLVLVTVGDEEFSQVGHPWMPGTPIASPDTFQYVRPIVYGPVSAGATVASLNLPFPAYAIARLNIPASATNITAGMITDLRELAQPRSKTVIRRVASPGGSTPNVSTDALTAIRPFPNGTLIGLTIPDWVNRAKVFGTLDGVKLTNGGKWNIRPIILDANVNPVGTHLFTWGEIPTVVDWLGFTVSSSRISVGFGDSIPVPAGVGRTIYFGLMCQSAGGLYDAAVNNLVADLSTTFTMQIVLEEVPS